MRLFFPCSKVTYPCLTRIVAYRDNIRSRDFPPLWSYILWFTQVSMNSTLQIVTSTVSRTSVSDTVLPLEEWGI